ncbi:MAG: RsmE family RNA methyltransferase [Parafilimonas sp.]
MNLPFFYQPNIISHTAAIILNEETSRHCIQVLRMKKGEQLQLTDGCGNIFTAAITKADKKNCEAEIIQTDRIEAASKKTSIAISLLKNANRLEWFMEKGAEIGVTEIIPLICHRTEKQNFRWDRMNSIIISAMLQSQQAWLPVLHQPIKFKELIDTPFEGTKLIAHCQATLKNHISQITTNHKLQTMNYRLLIGPEGDFTTEEIHLAIQNNYQSVSLGETRLRTETAGIVAAAWLVNLK